MNGISEIIRASSVFGVVLSLAGYFAGLALKKKFHRDFLNPLLIASVLVIGVLVALKIDYSAYMASAGYLSYLLTPATVCLAVPLYAQLQVLKKNFKAIFLAIGAGVLTSLVSIWLLSLIFGLSHAEFVTLLPKSVTTAIGLGISEELGGYPSITAAVIILTGIMGNVSGDLVCRIFRITQPVAKGLALGTASHAIGTARALEWGEIEGAMSGLAIAVSGLLTVVGASVFAMLK